MDILIPFSWNSWLTVCSRCDHDNLLKNVLTSCFSRPRIVWVSVVRVSNCQTPRLPKLLDIYYIYIYIYYMWPALTKVGQNRWEHHEINGEDIIYCFWFLFFHIVGHLVYHLLTAHSSFRPISDLKLNTHFTWQKPTLTKAVEILSAPFSSLL